MVEMRPLLLLLVFIASFSFGEGLQLALIFAYIPQKWRVIDISK